MFNNQYLWGYRAYFWTLTESYGLKLGRPTWIPTDSVCQEAREMASNGLTVDCLGISESTLTAKEV